ncbi:MAG: hypothetical protein ACK41T_01695 [Pseudobdellovibrio sp.]
MKNKKLVTLCATLALTYTYYKILKNNTEEKNTTISSKQNNNSKSAQKNETEATRAIAEDPTTQARAVALAHYQNEKDVSHKTKEILEETRRLKACLASSECDFPNTDPKIYEISIYDAWRNQITKPETKNLNSMTDTILKEAMLEPDGFLQSEVLALILDRPSSEQLIQAVVQGLSNNPSDPLILEKSMRVLQKYQNDGYGQSVDHFYQDTLVNGAILTSDKASELVGRVINSQNINSYKELLNSLKNSPKKYNNLKAAIENYEAQVTGG